MVLPVKVSTEELARVDVYKSIIRSTLIALFGSTLGVEGSKAKDARQKLTGVGLMKPSDSALADP
jgi:hypothetical protein